MNLLLIGYGKMGQAIARLAETQGHTLAGIVDPSRTGVRIADFGPGQVDAAIEFTHPEAAYDNVAACLRQDLPVVCGSTGWLHRFAEAQALCESAGGALFYASNFSIGVNLFFHLNEYLAARMQQLGGADYDVQVREIHHTQKIDQPSGTALTAAEGILRQFPGKTSWRNAPAQTPQELAILSERTGDVVGTHVVTYTSAADQLELRHEARSREGFAEGALRAAAYLTGRQGVFGMNDLLGLPSL